MITLPNNCRAGKFSVYPPNWDTLKADSKLSWRISYWFYDDGLKKRKKIVIKGMNHLSTRKEKQDAVTELLQTETELLIAQGFNHITKDYSVINEAEISENTPLPAALLYALKNLSAEKRTLDDIKSCLSYINSAIEVLGYENLKSGLVRRKHIKLILKKCGELKDGLIIKKNGRTYVGKWTPNNYNHYRSYLSMLISELVQVDAIDSNFMRDISKQKNTRLIRKTLSLEERKKVSEYLYTYSRDFWNFLQVFFHSGARIKEVLSVKKKDVDLSGQRFKVLIKKGKQAREVWKPIKDIAVQYWEKVYKKAFLDDYLFSWGLVPGKKMISPAQINRRWRKQVKQTLGIKADFYSLKHSNLDEIAEALNLQDAQKMADHSSPVVTMIYTGNEKQRQNNRIKKMGNEFA